MQSNNDNDIASVSAYCVILTGRLTAGEEKRSVEIEQVVKCRRKVVRVVVKSEE